MDSHLIAKTDWSIFLANWYDPGSLGTGIQIAPTDLHGQVMNWSGLTIVGKAGLWLRRQLWWTLAEAHAATLWGALADSGAATTQKKNRIQLLKYLDLTAILTADMDLPTRCISVPTTKKHPKPVAFSEMPEMGFDFFEITIHKETRLDNLSLTN